MAKQISGWIIKYGKPSLPIVLPDGSSVIEVFDAGALSASVDAVNAGQVQIEANIEHEDDALCRIGVSGSNVKVENRPDGVYATVDILEDSVSQDIFAKVQASVVRGLSIEFSPNPQVYYAYDASGAYVRHISKANLTGFAITVKGQYPDAKIDSVKDATRSVRTQDCAVILVEVESLKRGECVGKLIGLCFKGTVRARRP